MDADARAIKDIGRVLLFAAAYTLAMIAYYISKLLRSVLGGIPFVGGGIASAVDDALVKPAQNIMDDASADIAKGLSGLVDEAAIWVGLALLLGLGVKDALTYLWKHSLPAYVLSQTAGIVTKVENLIGRVNAVPGQIAAAFGSAYRDASKLADAAYASATGYTDAAVHDAVAMLRSELGTAVGDLRAAEDAAVTKAMQVAADGLAAARTTIEGEIGAVAQAAQAGIAAAETAAGAGLSALEQEIASKYATLQALIAAGVGEAEALTRAGITEAEAAAAAASAAIAPAVAAGIAAAEQAAATALAGQAASGAAALAATAAGFTSALGEVKSIAVTAEQEIGTVLGDLAPGDAAALIASIPLLATLVHTLATETGLENQACRQKIKGVCGTDPLAWGNLLAGLAAIGIGFSLADILEAAVAEIGGVGKLIGDLGSLAESDIVNVGESIGKAALRIAA